jgi:hypothetical protein
MKTFALVSQHLKRTVVAGVLAVSLLAGLGGVTGAAAQPINPNGGPSQGRLFCAGVYAQYYSDYRNQEVSAQRGDVERTARYSAEVVFDVAFWHSSGCQKSWGDIDYF